MIQHNRNTPSSRLHKQHGYSLVELALSLALLGVIIGSGLSLMTTVESGNNLENTSKRMDDLELAIQRFAKLHNRLPCAASPSVAEKTAGFGLEDDCSAASPALANIKRINAGTGDELWYGTVPTRSLGLPDSYMFDRWGNRFTYVVAKNFAAVGNTFSSENAANTANMLRVNDKTGNQINPSDINNPVVYLLLSHGSDMRGAYARSGTIRVACSAADSQADAENCDALDSGNEDQVFVDASLQAGTQTGEFFNDMLRWKTKINMNAGSSPPPPPPSNHFVIAVETVQDATCILTSAGKVLCSGLDSNGRTFPAEVATHESLGNGPVNGDQLTFQEEFMTYGDWIQLSGSHSFCGLRSNNQAYCWGEDEWGRLGNGVEGAHQSAATRIAGGENPTNLWSYIDVDYTVSCALDGTYLYCWGLNDSGQVGDNTTTKRLTPVEHEAPTSFTDWMMVSTGRDHVCGIRTNGRMYCWGNGGLLAHGKLGIGSSADSYVPIEPSGGFTDWWYVSANQANHTCAIRSTGLLYCWGANALYQLGLGHTSATRVPTQVAPAITDWVKVFTSEANTCAIRATGQAYCWGVNINGQVGTGDTSAAQTPRLIAGGYSDWVHIGISVGDYGCGARANGELYCWGKNNSGEFGNGSTSSTLVGPTLIPGTGS